MDRIEIHDHSQESLSLVVSVLLILFFPIGIIVFIARNISKLKSERREREFTKARTQEVQSDTSLNQSAELEAYHNLLQKGIITQKEFEVKKRSIMLNRKITSKQLR